MKTRILTSIAIILVVLIPIIYGGWLLEGLGLFILICSTYEWFHALPNYQRWGIWVWALVDLLILALPCSFVYGPQLNIPCLPFALISLGVVLVWSLPVFFESFSQNNCFAVMTFMVIMAIAFLCMQKLVFGDHRYLWTLCLATYCSDTGAYLVGRSFGKHKMSPRISPKKTWEGFFGGWAAGFLVSFLASFFWKSGINWTVNLLLCIFAPIAAELGDLCFSTFKRTYDLKDFSQLLPGHGGILDRIDSLLMNFILFGILISVLS